MSIYSPTYLYIKQHSITRKLYFGKTITNPEKYKGSGKHWNYHIKFHGKEFVETVWYCLFHNQEECTKFALMFSEQQNIVKSTEWLNLKPENGIDGQPLGLPSCFKGKHHSPESNEKNRLAHTGIQSKKKGKPRSIESNAKQSLTMTGRPAHNKGIASPNKGKLKPTIKCPHCNKIGGISPMKRWHFDNCKNVKQ